MDSERFLFFKEQVSHLIIVDKVESNGRTIIQYAFEKNGPILATFEGNVREDGTLRMGKLSFKNGMSYDGRWSEDQLPNQSFIDGDGGVFDFSDGVSFEGSVSDGLPDGNGWLYLPNGEKIWCKWDKAILISHQVVEQPKTMVDMMLAPLLFPEAQPVKPLGSLLRQQSFIHSPLAEDDAPVSAWGPGPPRLEASATWLPDDLYKTPYNNPWFTNPTQDDTTLSAAWDDAKPSYEELYDPAPEEQTPEIVTAAGKVEACKDMTERVGSLATSSLRCRLGNKSRKRNKKATKRGTRITRKRNRNTK